MKPSIKCNDNLAELRKLPDASVDLAYIDPPFNTGRNWSDYDDRWNSMDDYIEFMKPRLDEMRRILKPTGSIMIHADHHAVHYLKVHSDGIFGEDNFRGEFFWIKKKGHQMFKDGFDNRVDTILYYAKSNEHESIPQHAPVDDEHLKKLFPSVEPETGRRFSLQPMERKSNKADSKLKTRVIDGKVVTTPLGWVWSQKHIDGFVAQNPLGIYRRGSGRVYYKKYDGGFKGMRLTNAWTDIDELQNVDKERIGYKTQKPESLLDRVINISTNPGDVVLDAFAGSGTTCAVAKKLGRKSICIDKNPRACKIMEERLR